MICDPPPPPALTVAPVPRFTVRSVQVSPDPNLAGAAVQGSIAGPDGQRLAGLTVTLEGDGRQAQMVSNPSGEFYFSVSQPGVYALSIEGDESSRLTLELELHDKALVEWVASQPESYLPLPLAEIRSVDIVWKQGLAFAAETPWPGARCRWTASGGSLLETDDGVVWHPPAGPGRYLLQVVADWGRSGLAVDAAVLVVEDDGSVTWL
jgi:hypothetical protein